MRQGKASRLGTRLVLLALGVAVPLSASANMGRLDYDLSLNGQILPRRETRVQVVSETLGVRFEHGGPPYYRRAGFTGVAPRAFVRAQYALRNPTPKRVELHLAFPIVAGDLRDHLAARARRGPAAVRRRHSLLRGEPKGVKFRVSVDGQDIPHQSVPFEALIAGRTDRWRRSILDWMRSDDFVAALVRKGEMTDKDQTELRKHLANRKGLPPALAAVFANRVRLDHPDKLPGLSRWPHAFVCSAYHMLFPEARTPVAEAFAQWRVDRRGVDPHSGQMRHPHGHSVYDALVWRGLTHRVSFATFRVTLPPGAEREVNVTYDHLIRPARINRRPGPRGHEFQFQYILRTADHWRSFGPIALRVLVPEHLKAAFSLPLKYEGPRDGHLVFTARIEQPDRNLLVGMAEGLKNLPRREWDGLSECVGWLREYEEDPRGAWADDYLLRHTEYVCRFWDDRDSDRARREDWGLILKSPPGDLLRRIAKEFPRSNGGHHAAWMLIQKDLPSPDADHSLDERQVAGLIEASPVACVAANARYLLALCRMREGGPGAAEAFEAAAAAPAHWRLREQARWFAEALRGAKPGDTPLLKDWAEGEIRSALQHTGWGSRLGHRRRPCPVSMPVTTGEMMRIYRAHAERPLAYALLKRMAFQLRWHGRGRYRDMVVAWRTVLAELYWRAGKGEGTAAAVRRIRSEVLHAFYQIGLGDHHRVAQHARNSRDTRLRRLGNSIRHRPLGL